MNHILSIICDDSPSINLQHTARREVTALCSPLVLIPFVPCFSSTCHQLDSFFSFQSCSKLPLPCLNPHILYLCNDESWNRRHVITFVKAHTTKLTWELMKKKKEEETSFEICYRKKKILNPPTYLPFPICSLPLLVFLWSTNIVNLFFFLPINPVPPPPPPPMLCRQSRCSGLKILHQLV